MVAIAIGVSGCSGGGGGGGGGGFVHLSTRSYYSSKDEQMRHIDFSIDKCMQLRAKTCQSLEKLTLTTFHPQTKLI